MPANKKYDQIAMDIQAMIEQDNIEIGSRLPTERELSIRFSVSRSTIRQAVIHLQALGQVQVKPGSGTYVINRSTDFSAALPETTALELTQARSLLESESASLAAVHITDEELDILAKSIDIMNAASRGTEKAAEDADRDFHLVIARASRNRAIHFTVQMFWRMRNEIPAVKQVYDAVCTQDTGPRGKEHSDIYEALLQRDPMAARVAMRSHFHRLLESMLDVSTTQAMEAVQRHADEERQRFLGNPTAGPLWPQVHSD